MAALRRIRELEAEVERLRTFGQEVHDALDGRPPPGGVWLNEAPARVERLKAKATLADEVLGKSVLIGGVLVHKPGTTTDDMGTHCLWCSWTSGDYDTPPSHDAQCPVTRYDDANEKAASGG